MTLKTHEKVVFLLVCRGNILNRFRFQQTSDLSQHLLQVSDPLLCVGARKADHRDLFQGGVQGIDLRSESADIKRVPRLRLGNWNRFLETQHPLGQLLEGSP